MFGPKKTGSKKVMQIEPEIFGPNILSIYATILWLKNFWSKNFVTQAKNFFEPEYHSI